MADFVSLPRMTAADLSTMAAPLPALSDPRKQDFESWENRHQQFHALLLEHCRAGDVPAASRLLAQHLSRAAVTLLASMDAGYEPTLLRAAVRQVRAAADAAAPPDDGRLRRR